MSGVDRPLLRLSDGLISVSCSGPSCCVGSSGASACPVAHVAAHACTYICAHLNFRDLPLQQLQLRSVGPLHGTQAQAQAQLSGWLAGGRAGLVGASGRGGGGRGVAAERRSTTPGKWSRLEACDGVWGKSQLVFICCLCCVGSVYRLVAGWSRGAHGA